MTKPKRSRPTIPSLNGIVPAKARRESVPKIKMPNRGGFVPDPEFDPARLFGKKRDGTPATEMGGSLAAIALIWLWGVHAMGADGLITIKSAFGPEETMQRLEAEVRAKGMTVFAHVDHAAGAAAVGLRLRPTDLLIFGNAKGGTPLMQSAQAIGIDLPLKALVWQDESGATWLSYNDPVWLAHRQGVGEEAKPIVNALTAALNALATKATAPP
jgi:uncharacterized protein (DUF302 family)